MPAIAGTLQYNVADFQDAAVQFRGPLLQMPTLSMADILKFMTLRPGVRYKEIVGFSTASAQIHPYRAGERQKLNLDLNLRTLATEFGACNADFEPNSAISTILGHRASQAMGEGLKGTPTAMEVLSLVAKGFGEDLRHALWHGEHDAAGKTTDTLFDGFVTILGKEITAGNVSAAKKNLLQVPAITSTNAVDQFKAILKGMDARLRREDCYIFCGVDKADAYNEAYLLTHAGVVYNTEYDQVTVEGSGKRLTIVPVPELNGCDYMIVCPKSNLLVGVDQMSDMESVNVGKYDSDVLTFEMRMFFGVQFESIDPRRFLAVKVAAPADSSDEDKAEE